MSLLKRRETKISYAKLRQYAGLLGRNSVAQLALQSVWALEGKGKVATVYQRNNGFTVRGNDGSEIRFG